METGSAVIIFIFATVFFCIVNHSIPSKYTKPEENVGGLINRSLVRFDYEKSPLHNIVYDGTGKGKTYFVRQYLKLDLNQDLDQDQDPRSGYTDQDQKPIIIVCKDERDWINPETGKPYAELNIRDISMITSKNMPNFKNSVIVLDYKGDKLNKDMA